MKFIATEKEKYRFIKMVFKLALVRKMQWIFFAGDNYELVLDDNAEFELLISFILIVDNMTSRNRGSIISLDIGFVFKEYKKFNSKWKFK